MDDTFPEQKKIVIPITITPQNIESIAYDGIKRALVFARFVITGKYNLQDINEYKVPEKIAQIPLITPIKEEKYNEWLSSYKNWSFCNSINEIIEYFHQYLETIIAIYSSNNKTITAKSSDNINDVINAVIKNNKRSFRKIELQIKYLKEQGISISEEDEKIVRSLYDIRNLLTHERGIMDQRPNLKLIKSEITIYWYKPHFSIKSNESGIVHPLEEKIREDSQIQIKLKSSAQKVFKIGSSINFSFEEVEEIAWTYWLLIHNIAGSLSKRPQSIDSK